MHSLKSDEHSSGEGKTNNELNPWILWVNFASNDTASKHSKGPKNCNYSTFVLHINFWSWKVKHKPCHNDGIDRLNDCVCQYIKRNARQAPYIGEINRGSIESCGLKIDLWHFWASLFHGRVLLTDFIILLQDWFVRVRLLWFYLISGGFLDWDFSLDIFYVLNVFYAFSWFGLDFVVDHLDSKIFADLNFFTIKYLFLWFLLFVSLALFLFFIQLI